MNANASSATASLSPVTSARRSLFSKLTSPLRSRTRNLTDFHIRPDDPHRQYSPGDLVKGAVVLTVVKPIRITHLTVCLHGFVRVFKHTGGANEAVPLDAGLSGGNNPRKTQYFGNGHASLFQDEVTLCGEGRLDAGVYEFNFELEFPKKGLPTSIDFERGTISYMISSTITRPTSIAATSTCDQKVSLVETVDIGPMHPPKPRTISLEPISRRTRRVRTLRNKDSGSQPEGKEAKPAAPAGETPGETALPPLPDESASECSSVDHGNPRSPVSVDFQSSVSATNSADSTTSSTSFRVAAASARSTKDSQQSSEKAPASDKTITATVELLKAGCLPGESLPLKISIKHTKAIKSMHGIIVTLYRQGRIDSAPPLSLFVDINGKEAERLKHEEYYPKSKTGLGGLSLSSAGSSSLFRKDLAQTFAPILVDPTTLTSVVNVSVRVPEDAFPTISGVPGQMISFKYHVEVVMDLGGKLAGSERHVPRVGTLSQHSSSNALGPGNGNPNMLSAWEGSIVDTDHIRREKSVVACLFEIIVGTTDSARKRGRGNSLMTKQASEAYEAPRPPPTIVPPTHEPIYEEEAASVANGHDQNGEQSYAYPYYDEQYQEYYDEGYGYQHYYPEHPTPAHANIHVPPPEIQTEEHLTEKDRLRRAEERLLPSRPPQEAEASSSSVLAAPSLATATAPSVVASAPEEDLYSDDATPYPTATPLPISGSSRQATTNTHLPSAPPSSEMTPRPHFLSKMSDQTPAPPPKDGPLDDKQELERRRMLAEASAPSDIPDEDNAGEGSSSAPYVATAPVILDEEYAGSFAHHQMSASQTERGRGRGGGGGAVAAERHDESLPRYER